MQPLWRATQWEIWFVSIAVIRLHLTPARKHRRLLSLPSAVVGKPLLRDSA